MESSEPSRRTRAIETAIVVAIGVLLFFMRFGTRVLDPSETDWLMARNDPAAYYLIWDFFRHGAWTFPLGFISNYLYPLGTTLPLADGLPLLAFPAKLLSPVLPSVFQFFGLWHCLSAGLQALFGYRIVRRFVSGTTGRLLGAALFLLTPAYLFREGHVALSGHWLILAAIDLYLAGDRGGWRRTMGRWCALCGVASLVHPYLLAMVLLFFGGLLLRPERSDQWPWRGRLVAGGGVALTILCVWWIAGNLVGLSADRASVEGYGIFSLNLDAFVNPMGWGQLLPALPVGKGQYEGFAYLGAGWILVLLAGVVGLALRRRIKTRLRPHAVLILLVFAAFVFALSNVVMFNDTIVHEFELPPFFRQLAGVFRSSGRFAWPVIYAGMTALTALLGSFRPRWAVTGLMSCALMLQVWDIQLLIFQKSYFESLVFQSRLVDTNWDAAAAASTGITTFPPFSFTTVERADYRDICQLAIRHRVPTTAGYAARLSLAAAVRTDSMRTALARGTADSTQLYICNRPSFPEVFAGLDDVCRQATWDGYLVCYNPAWPVIAEPDYTAARRSTLPDFLAERVDKILLMAVRDEATTSLSEADRQALRAQGIVDSDFTYRCSMAAVVDHGRAVWQRTMAEGRIELALAVGDTLGGFRSARAISLVSAGFESGNEACLRLDDKEEGFNGRGLNFLVLDDDQRLLEVAWFDTYAGTPGVIVTVADRRYP